MPASATLKKGKSPSCPYVCVPVNSGFVDFCFSMFIKKKDANIFKPNSKLYSISICKLYIFNVVLQCFII